MCAAHNKNKIVPLLSPASPRPKRTFLSLLPPKRNQSSSSHLLSPPVEAVLPTISDSYVSRKERRISLTSPYARVNSPSRRNTLTPPRSSGLSTSLYYQNSAYENSPTQRRRERRAKLREFLNTTQRINIPKVPDFSLMAKSSSEDYSPTLTTSRLVIRRTSDIDVNPFLVSPLSPTTRKSFSWSCQWYSDYPHHITPTYLNNLFTSRDQASLGLASLKGTDSSSYLDTMYITEKVPLGSGEYSKVLKVQDRETKNLYALKLLKKSVQGSMERKRYLSEARNMWRIEKSHPNIVQLYGVWEQCGKIYMRIELCKYGSLDRILMEQKPRGGIGQDRTWQCLIDISAGLEAIHNTNIVHLDLKPENIFVGSSGDLKIGDFGHSVMLPIHETDGIEGDRRYVAPELLNNQCGKFSDIFSLGVTVYEMLSNQCGKIPGKGPEWQSLRDGQFSFLPKMDEDWTDICGESTDVVLVESKPVRHVKFCQSQRKILDIIKEMMDADYQNRPLVRTIHMVASKQYATKTLNKLEALYTID